MPEFLVFRLYGMMASWGDIAFGEFRPTADHPSRSAVLGLLAAALGIRRDEEERLSALSNAYRIAIRVDAPGVLLRDYHTSQVPPAGRGRKKHSFATRREELAMPREELSTVLSTRDYQCDAVSTVCIWQGSDSAPYSLKDLAAALNSPVFVLYLGRKSCPPALPVHAQVAAGENLAAVLSSVRFPDSDLLRGLLCDGDLRVFWEGDQDVGIPAIHTTLRYDNPLSRKRWQFGSRAEHYGVLRSRSPCS
ncbi:type I-E CRISPR-associated protein Cas5/CasD [Methanoculleus sp. Wushi-C6]|uniref:Type I-E CRISPR-associated protein Cas5/CasD n=1 Tax=Methanoculleus caldifontis TaxID=2651577 RepID=A0ABU3X4A2_9EURY|nr:type I-E CRISPR-associated protein Cas5/CasD [Methanoculleus sp. Wushi-C6]MDV2482241.1 type I-E CRISPR-associated protein Cas5/CasD [Methanoculleus sp. Wushi-C6]